MAHDCSFVASLCKGVNETARLGIDFVDLLVVGETLSDPPTVTSSPAGPTISGQDILDDTKAVANVSGGTAGATYKIWFTVTSSLGQVRKRYISMRVEAE